MKFVPFFAVILSGGGSEAPPDPLAPDAPSLDLQAASDTGSSSTDNITSDTTPSFTITFGQALLENDVVAIRDNGSVVVSHTVTALEAGSGTIDLGLSALSDGIHNIAVRHTSAGHASPWSATLSITIDATGPTISTASTANCAENDTLAITLAANETVTWSLTGGADQARFEISGTTLRWASNGTKDYEAPNDADTNNTYVVQATATDVAGNATNKTITVTVTDVGDASASFTATDTALNEAVGFGITATFTDVDIGSPSASRVVVVGVNIKDAGAGGNITSVTVGATLLTEAVNSGSVNTAAIWYGVVASGATATIVVTQPLGIEKCGIAVAALDGVTTTPTSTAAKYAQNDQNSPYVTTAAITVPASGFGVAVAGLNNVATATSWGNMTEDLEENGAGSSINISHNSTPGAISPSLSGPDFTTVSVVAATWGP